MEESEASDVQNHEDDIFKSSATTILSPRQPQQSPQDLPPPLVVGWQHQKQVSGRPTNQSKAAWSCSTETTIPGPVISSESFQIKKATNLKILGSHLGCMDDEVELESIQETDNFLVY